MPAVSIEHALKLFDSACDHDRAVAVGGKPYVQCRSAVGLWRILSKLRQRTGPKYLELGCGTGKMTLVGQLAGFESSGIEWNHVLAKMALGAKECLNNIADYRIVQGSYYLDDYIESCKPQEDSYGYVKPAGDAYQRLGLQFSEVDVFYGYFWTKQAQHVWEMMAKYAKPGAVLVQFAERAALFSLTLNRMGLDVISTRGNGERFCIVTKRK